MYSGCNHRARVITRCEKADTCTKWAESLEERAAFDLGCPAKEMELRVLDDVKIGVEGCGKRATYLSGPNGAWVANTESQAPRPE